MKHFIFLFLFFIGAVLEVSAQEDPIIWGEIPEEDLTMTTYEADSKANALVLADFGKIIMELEGSEVLYRFQRHRRIKVLNASQFEMAQIKVPYFANTRTPEHITYLKAQSFAPNGDKLALKGKKIVDVINEEEESFRTFTFPNIQDGSVLEYRYEIVSTRFGALRDWYFQDNIPTRLSVLSTEMPNWFSFDYLFQGQGDLRHSEDQERSIDVRINTITKTRTKQYRMEDIPAMKTEPYMANVDDQRSRLRYQLKEIRFPNGTHRPYMTTWEDLSKNLLMDEQFGLQLSEELNHNALFNTETNAIINNTDSPKEKAQQLFQYLSKTVNWNGKYSLHSPLSLNESFQLKKANGGELNMMLTVLLRKAGISAHPLLISTRSNGQMVRFLPVSDQFNHLLVYANMGDENFFMDVSDELRPLNLPRTDAVNGMGWLVTSEDSRWVNLDIPFTSDTYFANLTLSTDGNISGLIKGDIKGYNALFHRTKYKESPNEKGFTPKWMSQFTDVSTNNFEVYNMDNTLEPFQVSMNCTIPNGASKTSEYLKLKPVICSNILENPFTEMERLYPIDLPYPMKEKYILELQIPDGYSIESLPEDIHLILPNEGAQFHYLIKQKAQKIQLVSRITIKQISYQAAEYLRIKSFFEEIIKKHKEEIILKKEEG